ncbi:two-component system, chemotaxis family, CheB/CheR fusion protein [Duganella sp. CF402]|uniref:chemotaxis protein CheB n=1 Tax=unclassified Duganella TaxID=2636909 RepID=UPI0008B44318|nr:MULTISPECIES: chemotaxis protein CheB [unclassified Duganella]RZT09538.1 two-component system CheB/CheR fusion protein [Duganella sp. BK701]SEL53367.1 two-component system, chemotaxis family, CheB/CheR fusion protein [Duganella sp. CF402]
MTKKSASPAAATLMPIVGIGASAGGLDPICEFLVSVPPQSGFAFVVVQHLDPLHKCMLPELLQRMTTMIVCEIEDGMAVLANRVYVIPPNHELTIEHHHFALHPPSGRRGHSLPIDTFFKSLAVHSRDVAVGILFSGMGADGSLGLKAIRDSGGLTLAQLPSSARFDPMPSSAIAARAVDMVELPGQMATRIAEWWSTQEAGLPEQALLQRQGLQQLFQLLLKQTGANFSDYKLSTVLRRIDRRMKLRQCGSLAEYVQFMGANPAEVELLFKELLIGVTNFFRDSKVWEYLMNTALPQLIAEHPEGAAFKAWVAACSTGEEAYSLAVAFNEVLERLRPSARYTLQIFATDLDDDAVDQARQGVFGADIEADVTPDQLQRYFMPAEKGGYRIRKDVRNMIIFARQNVISDPPFTKLDLLCCRNLLIYFTAKLQEQLIPLFHYALRTGGLLMLGSADTPGHFSELFAPMAGAGRIYRRLDASIHRVANYFPTRVSSASAPTVIQPAHPSMNGNLQIQVEQQLLKKHAPAAVLLNPHGDILYIHGRTGAYLEPAAGKANWNIHAMARDGLRHEMAELLKRATQEPGLIAMRGLIQRDEAGKASQAIDLTAEAMPESGPLPGTVLLTFASVPLPPKKRRTRSTNPYLLELEQQLAQARLEIQTVRDEMQASREELKSANEELQSTNEELQSTNEELTTSKEEMQSLNEELYTVNAELQSKVDDLSLVNGDMKNLLNSTDVATIFLDSELRIRRFTDQTTQIYKLIASDVNRPLSDIVNDLLYTDLEQDAQHVLRTLVFCEKQIETRSGGWYTMRIRPYRTVDNVIDGVVVTFINITELKQMEARLLVQSRDADRS